ncbi:MAG: hypothetical protein ACREMN_10645 [Gemmatimonadales bacterium]
MMESPRMRIVAYYAIWATICAAVAGVVMTLVHTWVFSDAPSRSAVGAALLGGTLTTLGIAAGQGVTVFAAGGLLARLGRTLRSTVLLGLLIGLFDFVLYFLQTTVPATELGWGPDLVLLGAAAALITALGSQKTA